MLSRPESAATTRSPRAMRPLGIVPAKPRKSWCGRLTHCTGRRKGALRRSSSTSTLSRYSSKMRARVPGRARAPGRDVVAVAGGDRQRDQRAKAERLGEFPVVGFDLAKDALAVIDEVDLVDREHDVAHAEQRNDDRMAMRLREQALARVDQHDREIGVGRASRHVAGELLMAGRVRDDERAPLGGEIAIGDVDGDALLAFGLEPVDQQRVVDRPRRSCRTSSSRARASKAGRRR